MNRYFFSTLLGVGMALVSFAQTTQFAWGLHATPNFSNRRLIVLGNFSESMIEAIEAREMGKFAYAGGAFAAWRADKLGFRMGLSFVETGYRTVREPIPDPAGAPIGASERREIFRNYHLEIPLELDFSHNLDPNNLFFFTLGAAPSYNLWNRQLEVFFAGDTQEQRPGEPPVEAFRRFNVALLCGMGWETALGPSLGLFVQPNFQFYLSGLLSEADINRSIYLFGIKTGFKFYRPG
jgi:hypothetical protein